MYSLFLTQHSNLDGIKSTLETLKTLCRRSSVYTGMLNILAFLRTLNQPSIVAHVGQSVAEHIRVY